MARGARRKAAARAARARFFAQLPADQLTPTEHAPPWALLQAIGNHAPFPFIEWIDRRVGDGNGSCEILPRPLADSGAGREASGGKSREEHGGAAWQKHQCDGQRWYWREDTSDWFLGDAPGPWQRYQDPESRKMYWWKSDGSQYFWDTHYEGPSHLVMSPTTPGPGSSGASAGAGPDARPDASVRTLGLPRSWVRSLLPRVGHTSHRVHPCSRLGTPAASGENGALEVGAANPPQAAAQAATGVTRVPTPLRQHWRQPGAPGRAQQSYIGD